MALFVIAGKADCQSYAKIEALADRLSASLPKFKVNKIVLSHDDWAAWLRDTCTQNGWKHSTSPLVWRELIDRGGKGLYMGGEEEFLEYSRRYYGMEPNTTPDIERKIAIETDNALKLLHLEQEHTAKLDPLVVCITHSSSPLAYHLLACILSGATFRFQPLKLNLLDREDCLPQVQGLAMELVDMASPYLVDVYCTSSLNEAFAGTSAVFILDPPAWREMQNAHSKDSQPAFKMEQHSCSNQLTTCASESPQITTTEACELGGFTTTVTSASSIVQENNLQLKQAAHLYFEYAQTIHMVACKEVKVVICGFYTNLGVAVLSKTLGRERVIGSSSLAEQKARSLIAKKLNINSSNVKQIAILGKANKDVVADLTKCHVHCYPGSIVGPPSFSLPVHECIHDTQWMQTFPSLLIDYCKPPLSEHLPNVLCEAAGISRLMQSWMEDDLGWRSVVLVPDYTILDVPKGVALSIPAICSSGHWTPLVNCLEGLPDHILNMMKQQILSLQMELQVATDKLPT